MSANDGGVVKFERWVARHGWLYWITLLVALSMLGSIRSVGPLLFLGGIGAGVWYQLQARGRHLPTSDETPGTTPWVAPPSSRVSDARQNPVHLGGSATTSYRPSQTAIFRTGSARPERSGIPVVGTSHYRGWGQRRGQGQVALLREPSNSYDPNAIVVLNGRTKIGYLPRERAAIIAPMLDVSGQRQVAADAFFDERRVWVTLPQMAQPKLAPQPGYAQLEPVTPWGRGQLEFDIEFEAAHRAEVTAVYREAGVPISASGTVLDDLQATVMPSQHPGAPAVLVGAYWVGNLSNAPAAPYLSAFDRLATEGRRLQVRARAWAINDRGTVRSNIRIYLPDPEEIDPPGPMPHGAHILLPHGRKIQVTEEERYLSEVAALLGGSSQQPVVATLHITSSASARAARERVEVRVYGEVVGVLTAHMSEHFLPLIKVCEEEGVTVACRAIVKGNQIKADVELDAARAGDLRDDWITKNLYGLALQLDAEEIAAAAASIDDHGDTPTARPADMWSDDGLGAAPQAHRAAAREGGDGG